MSKDDDRVTPTEQIRKLAEDITGYLANRELADEHQFLSNVAVNQLINLADRLEEASEAKLASIQYADFLDIWNRNCGKLPKARVLTPDRRSRIKQLVEAFGFDQEAAMEALTLATRQVAGDPWWLGDNPTTMRYGFDTLVPTKVVQKMEIVRDEFVTEYADGEKVEVYGYIIGTMVKSVQTAAGWQYLVDVGGQLIWCDGAQVARFEG